MNKKDTELNAQINSIKQELANLKGTKEGELLTTFFEETLRIKGWAYWINHRSGLARDERVQNFIKTANELSVKLISHFKVVIPNNSTKGVDVKNGFLTTTLEAANAVSRTYLEIYELALKGSDAIKECVFDDCNTYLYTEKLFLDYYRCSSCRTRVTEGKNRFIQARWEKNEEEIERLKNEYPEDLFDHWDRGFEHRQILPG